jgi:uncharacterized protein (TIGR02466 family)
MNSQGSTVQAARTVAPGLLHVLSPAFASHVDVYAVEDNAALNSALLGVIAEWRRAETGVSASNQLGWHSPRTLFERDEPAFLQLFGHITHALTLSARRSWRDFDSRSNILIREGWANVNGKGAFNTIHEHDAFHFSGAYYVAAGSEGEGRSGAIEFLNPGGVSPIPLPNRAYVSPPKITLIPKTGSLMVFPSYLRHWVYPNQNDEDRVSIAFNFRLGNPE